MQYGTGTYMYSKCSRPVCARSSEVVGTSHERLLYNDEHCTRTTFCACCALVRTSLLNRRKRLATGLYRPVWCSNVCVQ